MALAKWKLAELATFFVEWSVTGRADVTVEHNVRIPDRITGLRRQVDVAVRYSQAGRRYLRTVEVQDRDDSKIGTPFIDQVVTKADRVGANRTTLVSVAGFTAPALARIAEMSHLLDAALLERIDPSDEPPIFSRTQSASVFDDDHGELLKRTTPELWRYSLLPEGESVWFVELYDLSVPRIQAAGALIVEKAELQKDDDSARVVFVALQEPGSTRTLTRFAMTLNYENGQSVTLQAVRRAQVQSSSPRQ